MKTKLSVSRWFPSIPAPHLSYTITLLLVASLANSLDALAIAPMIPSSSSSFLHSKGRWRNMSSFHPLTLSQSLYPRTNPRTTLPSTCALLSRGGSATTDPDPSPPLDYPSTPMPQLLTHFSTSPDGLSSTSASERFEKYGPNSLESPPSKSLLTLILEQFDDRLVQILLVVAFFSGILSYFERDPDESLLSGFVEPIIILSILILNAAVGVWQSKSAETSLEALKKMQPTLATVLRDGEWQDGVDASKLVPGDVISIRVGDRVPADARILSLQTSTLSIDEGSLTGESVTVQKIPGEQGIAKPDAPIQDQPGMIFSGTMVTSGKGTALVVNTGMTTEMGKIQAGVTEASLSTPKTPLGQKLDEFGSTLTTLIGLICLTVWIISIPKFSDPSFSNVFEGGVYYAKVAIALGVAAIPEGLPAVITLCLSLGTRRMAQRNVIVRKLPSVETLGCTSVICTDKTGTLTTNEMTAVSLVVFDEDNTSVELEVTGVSYDPNGLVMGIKENEISNNPDGSMSEVAMVSALCNDAKIVRNSDRFERVGEPTEAALCALVEKLSSREELKAVNGYREIHPRVATLEFDRERKSMSVLCTTSDDQNRLYIKGAPNLLLNRCTKLKLRSGEIIKLTGSLRREIEEKIKEVSTRPLRCLALAIKDHDELEDSLKHYRGEEEGSTHPLLSNADNFEKIESGLTLVGIVGIKDPARPEVKDSIEKCGEAGIRVVMITGDARDTAVAIAKDVGIFHSDEEGVKAFEGREFFALPHSTQLSLLQTGNLLFCRAEPSDKQKLIQLLQSLDEIPAMTGDGVNDAPALQQAAIGIAMGITGTEVAKEASDMILADDNFSTIVNAVEEGRCIYANMQAFICFLISCNIGEIFAILLATIAGFPEPLTAMHLLWVNLVTDGPPATALGFNPPSPDSMKKSPRPRNEPIMTRWLLVRYCLTGFYVGIATVGIFVGHYLQEGVTLSQLASWSKCGELWSPSTSATCDSLFQASGRLLPQTLSLTTLVCMEMIKALSAVSVDNSILEVGPQKNPWLILGVTVPFLLHLMVIYSDKLGIGGLGESFGVVSLSLENWITILQWSAPILIVDEILKAIGRRVNREREEERSKELVKES